MNEIKFIALIEPPTKKDKPTEDSNSDFPFANDAEYDCYQKRLIAKNYKNFPEPILSGIHQYRLFDIDMINMERIINLHIKDTELENSISLFGGYAISVNQQIELFPQCCGLLEEIQTWKTILDENFNEFYLRTSHPCPIILKSKNEIIIRCSDAYEEFVPLSTKKEIRLDYMQTKEALILLLADLTAYSNALNQMSDKFEVDNLANILIWGQNDI